MILLWGRRDTHWRTPFFGPNHPKERRPSDLHRADKTLKQSVQIRSKHGGMPRAIAFRQVLGSRLGRASGASSSQYRVALPWRPSSTGRSAEDSKLTWQIAEPAYISMSGLRRPRRRHFIWGWLCLTQNRPVPIGTRKTEVGLLLQHC